MRKRRFTIALHWQIIIALIFAFLFGIIFSTEYWINEQRIIALKKDGVQQNVLEKIQPILNTTYKNLSDFDRQLQILLNEKDYSKYKNTIITHSYFNPAVDSISWMGSIFLRALKMLVIPLILFSIVSGIGNISTGKDMGRLGLKTIIYYISTSLLAICTGLFLTNSFKPGIGSDISLFGGIETIESQKDLGTTLIEIVPENIVDAMAKNELLPIIFFSIIIGIFINKINGRYSTLLKDFFSAGFELFMKITLFVIKLAPWGVFGLVAKVIADQDSLSTLMVNLGLFSLTVLLSLFIHTFITLPLIVKFIGKAKPFNHFKNMSTALLTAFSTASSSATLPLTLHNVENNSGVSKKISNFTLPIGATVNMDGTAIYICAIVLFIAQAKGIDLNFSQQFILVLTTLLASIGAAGVPMASLVIMTIILTTLGLPVELIALVLPVDRILDMVRTATNVWSDSCGAVVIAKTEGETLNV